MASSQQSVNTFFKLFIIKCSLDVLFKPSYTARTTKILVKYNPALNQKYW